LELYEGKKSLKLVVLASGGVDSSVIMFLLKKDAHEVLPLFVDYGQLAGQREWASCKAVCKFLGLIPARIDISGFGKSIPSGITDEKLDIEKQAFLPTRNLLFLTVGAAYAYSKLATGVAIGILANPIFPDQTAEFIVAAEKTIKIALGSDIAVLAPLISLDKRDTLNLAIKYNLPLDLMSYCHSKAEKPCGSCISCKERMAAEKYIRDINSK
jgi:7-cyano-7-deazaguanine synthase